MSVFETMQPLEAAQRESGSCRKKVIAAGVVASGLVGLLCFAGSGFARGQEEPTAMSELQRHVEQDGCTMEQVMHGCTRCSESGCLACKQGLHLADTDEGKVCAAKCTSAQTECNVCADQDTCLVCAPGFALNDDGSCRPQDCDATQSSSGCQECHGAVCKTCKDGFRSIPLEDGGFQCVYPCNSEELSGCRTCHGPGKCGQCRRGYALKDGVCVTKCSDDTLKSGCVECNDDGKCAQCDDGHVLVDGKCSYQCRTESTSQCRVDLGGQPAHWWIRTIEKRRCSTCGIFWINGNKLSGSGFPQDWWNELPSNISWWHHKMPHQVLEELELCKPYNTQVGCSECSNSQTCTKCKEGYQLMNGFCMLREYKQDESITMAHLCKSGYCTQQDRVKEWNCGSACDRSIVVVPGTVKTWVAPRTDQGVTLARFKGQQLVEGVDSGCVIIFRGTNGAKQRSLNNECSLTPFDDGDGVVTVHWGFNTIWNSIKHDLAKGLEESGCRNELLFITGHSLGGGISSLAAYALQVKMGFHVAKVYAFAGPRVGRWGYAEEFNKHFNGPNQPVFFRVTHYNDMVPHLPPSGAGVMYGCSYGFTHHAVEIYYHKKCTFDCPENAWKVCEGNEDSSCANSWSLASTSSYIHCRFFGQWVEGGFCCCGYGVEGTHQQCFMSSPVGPIFDGPASPMDVLSGYSFNSSQLQGDAPAAIMDII
mmetsp:Transcript_28409/g.68256  ORF Transcript_28409/g.68256 Transcript_28409/m.68256 type:complete len:705 (-) Transcript_28409:101-2215(-)